MSADQCCCIHRADPHTHTTTPVMRLPSGWLPGRGACWPEGHSQGEPVLCRPPAALNHNHVALRLTCPEAN